ncbi:hypothetical protein HWV62_6391 [Athelia sp. TMB]|nr:hypothetical protein HWV62_6391 [Athelia sp. TMB]
MISDACYVRLPISARVLCPHLDLSNLSGADFRMVQLHQAVLSLLLSPFSQQPFRALDSSSSAGGKSVAIIGAGSAGLAALKTFLDLPRETRGDWDIVLFEQRRDVGGIWLPDPHPAAPPNLPETPLYPQLRTNTPVPAMTYPGFLFPPNTPLFPQHDRIKQYHEDYASHFNLFPHIRFNHSVTYHSVRGAGEAAQGAIAKPEISHFTHSEVVFVDGTVLADVDTVLLGTGYELRMPFLERGHALQVDRSAHSNTTYTQGLVTNTRYLFPVHRHIFSLCPNHPVDALAFIGLPLYVSNCPSDIAQSLYAAHVIANPGILPSRKALLKELALEEERLRSLGLDPYHIGHRILPRDNGTQWDYQDKLVADLKQQGAIPEDGKPFVEKWRREPRPCLRRGWKRVESLGTEAEWLDGVESEGDWAGMMNRLNRWQCDWEEERGEVYPQELV